MELDTCTHLPPWLRQGGLGRYAYFSMTVPVHRPVMVDEVVSGLAVRSSGRYIDCTVGEGGHTRAILEATSPAPTVLGLDVDIDSLSTARRRLEVHFDNMVLVRGSYTDVTRIANEHGFSGADGVVFDLGFSSAQLERPERGFSFASEGPLDMRFDQRQASSATHLVNQESERKLADLIYRFGEERQSRRIAKAIVSARPIDTTSQLAGLVARAVRGVRGRIHPATRTFQALRMVVNDELKAIESGLEQAVRLLIPGGRVVVISYHSLEDRLVKEFIRRESKDCICEHSVQQCTCRHTATLRILTKKVVKPAEEEQRFNPRSRSAKLRIAESL